MGTVIDGEQCSLLSGNTDYMTPDSGRSCSSTIIPKIPSNVTPNSNKSDDLSASNATVSIDRQVAGHSYFGTHFPMTDRPNYSRQNFPVSNCGAISSVDGLDINHQQALNSSTAFSNHPRFISNIDSTRIDQ